MAGGVVKTLGPDDRSYYTAEEVQSLMGVSRDKAYTMIRSMRQECIDSGKLTGAYPTGRIPKKYFNAMCMID